MDSAPLEPTKYHARDDGITAARLLVIALILLGFGLRLYRFGGESLWYDETVSAYLAGQPWASLIAHTARDIHPPAYYLLLRVWTLIASPTPAFGLEYLYAWPSLIFEILTVALTFAVARRCFNNTTAIWALALACVQPTQVWASQEVRMYALGTFALLLTLWAVSPILAERRSHFPSNKLTTLTLLLYPLAALLGVYTLYYFLFWLFALNLAIILKLWNERRALLTWIALQFVILVGWIPWLPTFIRQAVDPPVPPWRQPWATLSDLASAFSESLAALWLGHVTFASVTILWAFLIIATAIFFYLFTKSLSPMLRGLWLLLAFGPLLLLVLATTIGPPIYHVRYVTAFAPVFALLLAALLTEIRRPFAYMTFALYLLISAGTLQQLWTNPLYAADDHRHAVERLAMEWRPGDAILVNAGWVYTALSVYWPTELPFPPASRPPAIAATVRLSQVDKVTEGLDEEAPIIIRSGSVDGPGTLGWGLPESDFFGLASQDTTEMLAHLAANHTRLWQYRLYDTVSDPQGVIRKWLDDNLKQELSEPIPGRDFLRLERYATGTLPALPSGPTTASHFPDLGLALTTELASTQIPAGETLYVRTDWQRTNPTQELPPTSLSLRLYDPNGKFLFQSDSPLVVASAISGTLSLAMPLPADTIPGNYQVALILYDPETLAPYESTTAKGVIIPAPLNLGNIELKIPLAIPHTTSPIATFDYIDLLDFTLPITMLRPGENIDTKWTWRPQASEYRDHYKAHLSLSNENNPPISISEFDLGGDSYPSSVWPEGYPLGQSVSLTVPNDLPAGTYQLNITVRRASDDAVVAARQPWQFGNEDSVVVGEMEIETSD